MIYFIFNDTVAEGAEIPQYVAFQRSLATIPLVLIQAADFIFEFEDGKTVYHKDRTYKDYQYTSEERLVLTLRSVLT